MAELDPAVAPLHHRLHLAALHHDPFPLSDRLAGPLDRLRFDPPAWIMSCNGLLGAPKWTAKHSKAGPRQGQVENFLAGNNFTKQLTSHFGVLNIYLQASLTRTVLNPISMECMAVAFTQMSVAIPVT